MDHKASLCLDTTIPSALFQPPEDRAAATARFFEEAVPQYEVLISEVGLAEVRATQDPDLRQRLISRVEGFRVLPRSPQAKELAQEYLKYIHIPESDALHLAIATIERCGYLVTWNMRHMAKERTRRVVDNVNFLRRLQSIFIVTPYDLLD